MNRNLLLLGLCLSTVHGVLAAEPSVARQAELKHLLLHDCGSCHGMTLNGGLGPALTPDVLENKPAEYLFQVISNGLPNTPMPPWEGILDEAEMRWIAGELKDGLD
ncbi:MAG: cytochrome c [Gammaproteobacteria bacterium]|jgi:cytochrome c55X|nr:cytochrome c [Gammaproteobacteria bacterium]MBT4494480.1 cytochrome c [Gammaproteobacteria bacterium]MBT7371853.1 cytochrome c [Gammaproteobacteria bacterium]